jgi:hypothetical protein
MTRLISILALALALAACDAATDATPSPSVEPSEQPSATAEPTQEPTMEPAPTTEPSPSPSAASDGRFQPAANAEADALFVERDTCENRRDGYQLVYPDDWYTNTEFRDVAPCSWFAPTTYEVDDSGEVPDEIAIALIWVADAFGYTEDPIKQEAGTVGGQTALRLEFEDSYGYVIWLGPSVEDGPYLAARTARDMGGDYELNKAILDRLMLTIEFIGSTQ